MMDPKGRAVPASDKDMSFPTANPEPPPVSTPQGYHGLLIELLRFLTALLSFLVVVIGSAKFPWLSKSWMLAILISLGIAFLMWLAKPRLTVWLQNRRTKKRDREFIAAQTSRLIKFVNRFAQFVSLSDTRSLIVIIRAAYSQNVTAVEQVLTTDHIRNWFQAFIEELRFPTDVLLQFLARCREFTTIVQQFNNDCALHAQSRLANGASIPDECIEELEKFRGDYTAFLRGLEEWSDEVCTYLQSAGVNDYFSRCRLAPLSHFERLKAFHKSR
jgi:hypothetical protein